MAKKLVPLSFLVIILIISSCSKDSNPTNENPISPSHPWLVVLNNLGYDISILDLEDNNLYTAVVGTGEVPNDLIAVNYDLFVVNSTSNNISRYTKSDSTLLLEDVQGVGVNTNPFSITSKGDRLYVSCLNTDEVVVLVPDPLYEEDRVEVGTAPEGILYYQGNVYVACTGYNFQTYQYEDGYIYQINTSNHTVSDSIKVGINPQHLIKVEDKIHVCCTGDYGVTCNGRIYIINPGSFTVEDSLLIEGTPLQMCYDGYDTIWVAAGGWAGSGEVYCYTASGSIVHGSTNPIQVPTGAMDVAYHQGRLFVSCFQNDSLVELRGDSVVNAWAPGDGPQSIIVW